MFNQDFIVYVVNMKKDIKRKHHIINELTKQQITNFEFIEGVDGSLMSEKEIVNETYSDENGFNKWNVEMSNGEIGCSLSHVKVYKKLIESKYNIALILEDDAVFLKPFSKILSNFILSSFSNKKQIILISEIREFYKKPIKKINNYELVKVTNAFFTHSYFINKPAAKAILSFNYPVKTTPDNFLFFHLYCGVKLLGLNPFITTQDKKNHKTNITILDTNNKRVKLLKRKIFKLKIKILKYFIAFGTHS